MNDETTFLKASHDESREVRYRGAEALGALARHHARIEPLVTDLRKVFRREERRRFCFL